MTPAGAVGAAVLALTLSAPAAHAQAMSQYRDYQLGGNLASVAALAGVSSADAQLVHQRPALMQDLHWRRPYSTTVAADDQADPVQEITFSFYKDQLFRLVIDYDRERTTGMTDADLVEALSTVYGPTIKANAAASRPRASELEQQSGTVLARWRNGDCASALYRSSYASGFRLIVTSVRLDALARVADAQAARLDANEAPQREIARRQQEADATRAAAQKARAGNKAAFRP